jgi:CheY-specific phosphatase CheX
MTSVHLELREILTRKAHELFADYGVICAAGSSVVEPGRQLCGILGFTGDHLCGCVVLAGTHEAIADSNPMGDGAQRGWVAELTNQVVGRFKNALLRCGVDVAMSIPVVLTATQLMPLPQTAIDPIRLAVGRGQLSIWLEVDVDAALVLAEPSLEAAAAEGEALLF